VHIHGFLDLRWMSRSNALDYVIPAFWTPIPGLSICAYRRGAN
jgi:hypothetical protein